MLLDHTNLRKTLRSLEKGRVLEIFCNKNVNSVCSIFVFTQILKAELFTYQIEFKDMDKNINFMFKAEEGEYFLKNECESCTCTRKDTVGITSLYKTLKSMDFIKIETIWPVAVCFSHFKIFLNEKRYKEMAINIKNKERSTVSNTNENSHNDPENISNVKAIDKDRNISAGEMCNYCQMIQEEIFYSIRMLNNKSEGLTIQKRNKLDFLYESSLFKAMKNDIDFIHQKKLFYNKNGSVERKIGEFLAKFGISINSALNPYNSLDMMTKRHCNSIFGEEEKFVYRNGHDIEISAVEHSFLILFYLYKEKEMFSYLCLEKRKLIDLEKVCKFHEKIVSTFKDSVLGASRSGNLGIFHIKSQDFSIPQISSISYVLYRLIRIYLIYKEESDLNICIYYNVEDTTIMYSEDIDFSIIKERCEINENLIKIDKQKFVEVIKKLSNK